MELRALTASAVYGNRQLDAMKGYKDISRSVDDIRNMVFYMDKNREFSRELNSERSEIGRQIMLLNEIKKNVTKDVLAKKLDEIDKRINANREQHILGGKRKED